MYLWAKATEIVKNEKLQCTTNQDSDVTYCKRCNYSRFCIGGETMDQITCEEQGLVLTKELIKCTTDVERTKPNRLINLQSGIPKLKRQFKQLILSMSSNQAPNKQIISKRT